MMGKDTQHVQSSGKCNLKPQRDTTHSLERLKTKQNYQYQFVGKHVEQRKLSYSAGENVKCYNRSGIKHTLHLQPRFLQKGNEMICPRKACLCLQQLYSYQPQSRNNSNEQMDTMGCSNNTQSHLLIKRKELLYTEPHRWLPKPQAE